MNGRRHLLLRLAGRRGGGFGIGAGGGEKNESPRRDVGARKTNGLDGARRSGKNEGRVGEYDMSGWFAGRAQKASTAARGGMTALALIAGLTGFAAQAGAGELSDREMTRQAVVATAETSEHPSSTEDLAEAERIEAEYRRTQEAAEAEWAKDEAKRARNAGLFESTMRKEGPKLVKWMAGDAAKVKAWETSKSFPECRLSADTYAKLATQFGIDEKQIKAEIESDTSRVEYSKKKPEGCSLTDPEVGPSVGSSLMFARDGRVEVAIGKKESEVFVKTGDLEILAEKGMSPENAARFIALHEAAHAKTMRSWRALANIESTPEAVDAWFEKPEARRLHPDTREDMKQALEETGDSYEAVKSLIANKVYLDETKMKPLPSKHAAFDEALADTEALAAGRKLFGWGDKEFEAIEAWRVPALMNAEHSTSKAVRAAREGASPVEASTAEAESAIACAESAAAAGESVKKACGERAEALSGASPFTAKAVSPAYNMLSLLEARRAAVSPSSEPGHSAQLRRAKP